MSENKKEDAFMYLSDRFDQHKLNHLIKHADDFRSKMTKCDDEDYNPFAIAIKYLAKSRNGLIKTSHLGDFEHRVHFPYNAYKGRFDILSPASIIQTLI